MITSILIPFIILVFLGIAIATIMIHSYNTRRKKRIKNYNSSTCDPRLGIYREKESALRAWYCVLCGLDLTLLLLGIFGNACSIFMTVTSREEQNIIVALMILSFVSYSLRDALGIASLRKTYMKAVRHLEVGLDKYEFDCISTDSKTYLTDLYEETQQIIEDRFE